MSFLTTTTTTTTTENTPEIKFECQEGKQLSNIL